MTKDRVLAILKAGGAYVSGEEISRALGISRAAVNAAVQSLRRDGYGIRSATNRGYFLSASPDRISAGELLALLPAGRMERVVCLDTVDSTNNYLRTPAQGGAPDGLVAVANEQTGGRGRLGRGFHSPKDKGIYLSMLMRPGGPPAQAANITAWVAVAACDSIQAACGVRPRIKWVNDLVLGGKKICGILTEMSVEGESGHIQHVITGIGVNANQREDDFPQQIRHIAASLSMETGAQVNRARLAAALIARLDQLRADWPDKKGEYLAAYRGDCVTLGNQVRFAQNGIERTGRAEDIDEDFGLVVRFGDGSRESVKSGEVSVRGLYGYV